MSRIEFKNEHALRLSGLELWAVDKSLQNQGQSAPYTATAALKTEGLKKIQLIVTAVLTTFLTVGLALLSQEIRANWRGYTLVPVSIKSSTDPLKDLKDTVKTLRQELYTVKKENIGLRASCSLKINDEPIKANSLNQMRKLGSRHGVTLIDLQAPNPESFVEKWILCIDYNRYLMKFICALVPRLQSPSPYSSILKYTITGPFQKTHEVSQSVITTPSDQNGFLVYPTSALSSLTSLQESPDQWMHQIDDRCPNGAWVLEPGEVYTLSHCNESGQEEFSCKIQFDYETLNELELSE